MYRIPNEDVLEDEKVENEWKNLENALVGSAGKILSERRRIIRKVWMTQDLLNLMGEWIMQKHDEIKDLDKAHSSRFYDKIKELESIKRLSKNNVIEDEDGNILVENRKYKGKMGGVCRHTIQ